MNTEIWSILLLISAGMTGITTQAIKILLTEHNKSYSSNTLAGYVAIAVSIVICLVVAISNQISVDAVYLCNGFVLAVLSWLSAMVGYDKIIQLLDQISHQIKGD